MFHILNFNIFKDSIYCYFTIIIQHFIGSFCVGKIVLIIWSYVIHFIMYINSSFFDWFNKYKNTINFTLGFSTNLKKTATLHES